jgi:hypothetical protein
MEMDTERRFGFGPMVAIALVVGALIIGALAYNAGYSQGVVEGVSVAAPAVVPQTPGTPVPYYGRGFYAPRPFGGGFSLFGLLFGGLIILLIIGFVRRAFWRGAWGRGGWWHDWGRADWRGERGSERTGERADAPGQWQPGQGVPPPFEEWHRRAHAGSAPGAQTGESGPTENRPPQV